MTQPMHHFFRLLSENWLWLSLILAALLSNFAYNKKWYKRKKYRERIIIFSRYPQPGTTKTRLIAGIGDCAAAKLQHIMTNQILDRVISFQKSRASLAVELWYNGGTSRKLEYWLGRKSGKSKFYWIPQKGVDLGHKMAYAFKDALQDGSQYVLIVGSDIPAIDDSTLTSAMTLLHNNVDMILGPAQDGGYYLIGLNSQILQKLGKKKLDCLFEGMEWGTERVKEQQIAVAKKHNIHVTLLPTILQDIDTVDDLSEFERSTGVTLRELTRPKLSVIVPVLNEEHNIHKVLRNIITSCTWPESLEIILVDGGSSDGTRQEAHLFSKEHKDVIIKIVSSKRGRGVQQNTGVSSSSGDNLLFLHADTTLPKRYDEHVVLTLAEPGVSAGAFRFGLDYLHADNQDIDNYSRLFRWQMELLEWGVNYRSINNELPYGDQAIFLTKRTFDQVGGFPAFLLFEDFILIKKLQQLGHVQTVEDEYAVTSTRRLKKHGYIKTVGLNILLVLAYRIGVHPNTLARWYYGC
ncbi:uncharacterized protein LOC117112318 [Anneissia japonica]|uniref:uncharacterized protein LOC117112318 n=1 Tax=Anneissia japonica TaxID=1529436 RepID=UPI001425B3FE|nr:uncharacterized protein LOC117112318 [Anneissia japonica]